LTRPSIFIRDKATSSSERMLHKDMTARVQLKEKSVAVSLMGLGAKTN
jgi:hypothetical protein